MDRFSLFTAIALLSIISFIFKIKNLNLITKSIAPIGLLFTCLAIITGSLWGNNNNLIILMGLGCKNNLNVSTFNFYILFILAHKLIENKDKANKVSNLIAIIGFSKYTCYFSKYSVELVEHSTSTFKH